MFHSTLPQPGRKVGGVEVFVHRLSNHLVERGHNVTVFTFDDVPVDALYTTTRIGSPWIGLHRVARLTLAPLMLNRLSQAKIDVLHLHGDDWLMVDRRVPTVRTFYGSALWEARAATSLKRQLSQAAVYPLEGLASRLATRSFGIGTEMPLGYRLAGSLPLAAVTPEPGVGGQRANRPTVLFVGTWEGRKRGELLADIFARDVLPRHPSAELIMVSDRCEERPGIRWVRFPDDGALSRLFETAWVYCMPSSYEGFGLPYLEAMAHGLPVVASPNPGARYVLRGGAGLLVEDSDLGTTLADLISDENMRLDLADRGRLRADDFSWCRVLNAHERAYELVTQIWSESHSQARHGL